MILPYPVNLKEVFEQEKAYRWPRPDGCRKCGGSRIWGHGYVLRYFDGFAEGGMWLKRWRCPDCGSVHTVRPEGYWRGFWAKTEDILLRFKEEIRRGCWLKEVSRQRQQYWWRGLRKQWLLFREGTFFKTLTPHEEGLKVMLRSRIIVAAHSVRSFKF
jgi:hypothetical protein